MFGKKSGEHREFKFFKNFLSNVSSKLSFVLGLISGIAIFGTLSFFLLYGVFLKTVQMQNLAILANAQEENKLVAADAPQQPTEEEYEEPEVDPSKLSPITKDDYVLGNFDAPVTLILFTDFQCPYCARHGETINQVAEEYKDKVRIVLKEFPLGFHDQAQNAAEAAECAGEQGKFWEMHDKLFTLNEADNMSVESFKKAAAELNLKTDQFNKCLDESKYAEKIQADYEEGIAAGVQGTPATFVNGELISGAIPYEQFKTFIDSELQK